MSKIIFMLIWIEHEKYTIYTWYISFPLQVHTTKGTFYCRKVIVTSGAWVNHVLGSVGVHIPIYVTQEQVTYFATPNMKDYVKEK